MTNAGWTHDLVRQLSRALVVSIGITVASGSFSEVLALVEPFSCAFGSTCIPVVVRISEELRFVSIFLGNYNWDDASVEYIEETKSLLVLGQYGYYLAPYDEGTVSGTISGKPVEDASYGENSVNLDEKDIISHILSESISSGEISHIRVKSSLARPCGAVTDLDAPTLAAMRELIRSTDRVINLESNIECGNGKEKTKISITPARAPMVCGPDITKPLLKVLGEVAEAFYSNNQKQKAELCRSVRAFWNPKKLAFAWDIEHLWLPYTYWLYNKEFDAALCGYPHNGEPGSREIETLANSPCGNSVQVGDHCYLARTANYALFGMIARLCDDEFHNFSKFSMIRTVQNWVYRFFGRDDPGPPVGMAMWGFDMLSGKGELPEGNRDECTMRCPIPANIKFTWRWLPYYGKEPPLLGR